MSVIPSGTTYSSSNSSRSRKSPWMQPGVGRTWTVAQVKSRLTSVPSPPGMFSSSFRPRCQLHARRAIRVWRFPPLLDFTLAATSVWETNSVRIAMSSNGAGK
jgi:hypothetical protein